ncbi:hypothetical protein [Stenotrophomonas phage vB_SmaS_P15]|uniref:Uncharacterized protein n=1 Tax=Stenotrophomonas phage vB_SmaS_P15 TaxID=2894592 RepID=A0AAE8YFM1_9CAUD|nr:hypothetical protein [Stenotrophomonas phage vB_SmaS_P15]
MATVIRKTAPVYCIDGLTEEQLVHLREAVGEYPGKGEGDALYKMLKDATAHLA